LRKLSQVIGVMSTTFAALALLARLLLPTTTPHAPHTATSILCHVLTQVSLSPHHANFQAFVALGTDPGAFRFASGRARDRRGVLVDSPPTPFGCRAEGLPHAGPAARVERRRQADRYVRRDPAHSGGDRAGARPAQTCRAVRRGRRFLPPPGRRLARHRARRLACDHHRWRQGAGWFHHHPAGGAQLLPQPRETLFAQ